MERELIKRKKRGFLWRDESGQVLILVALAAVFLIGMAALVVDIGHGFVVRQELQNAADASALAGAGNLLPLIGTFPTATPNYPVAIQKAKDFIPWNKADGQSLVTCDPPLTDGPPTGGWNLLNGTVSTTPGPQVVPYVKVTVSKNSTQNGPEVSTWFARIFGKDSFPVGPVSARAVISGPGFAPPGTPMIPVAISKRLAEHWDIHTYPSGPRIKISTSDKYDLNGNWTSSGEQGGVWTTLLKEDNSAKAMAELISTLFNTGTPTQINVGDSIYLQPTGNETNLYAQKKEGNILMFKDLNVYLPVVEADLTNPTKGWSKVIGFVGFRVSNATGGSTKTIEGWFTTGLVVPNSGGVGGYYGVYSKAPILVQ